LSRATDPGSRALLARWAAALLACVLVFSLASCGGGDDSKGKEKSPISGGKNVAVKQSLVPKGKSASSGGEVEDYLPEGDIVADSGFRPDTDGFLFENYGNDAGPQNLTPAEVQDLFGDQVCLAGTEDDCTLIPAADTWMKNQNAGMAGGHCEGFSITALRMFNEELDPNDYGAASPAALDIVGNTDLQQTIAENFTYQFLPPIVDARVRGAPSEVLDTLIDALNSGDELYTLGIYKSDGSAGHAITPFAVEDKGDGQFAILVYDNNFPGQVRAVDVDTNKESWSYSGGPNPDNLDEVYEGDASTKTLELDPETPLGEDYSPCPFCTSAGAATDGKGSKGTVLPADKRVAEVTVGGDPNNHPHLVFTDDQGRKTGVVNGRLIQQIPDVEVIKAYATENWKGGPEPRYRFPQGKSYTISVDGSNLTKRTKTSVNLLTNGLVIEIDEITLDPGQVDEMALPEGYGITYQTNSKDEEAPNFFAGLVEDDTAYNFAATAVGVKPGSTLSLLVEQKEKVVILDSTGSEGTINGKGIFILNLTKADGDGNISQWQNGDVRLDGSKEEKAGFEYGTSPTDGKPLPLVLLDKNNDVTDVIKADPN
jgi:hypothetical protein